MVGARDTNNEITKKSYTHTFIRKKPKMFGTKREDIIKYDRK